VATGRKWMHTQTDSPNDLVQSNSETGRCADTRHLANGEAAVTLRRVSDGAFRPAGR